MGFSFFAQSLLCGVLVLCYRADALTFQSKDVQTLSVLPLQQALHSSDRSTLSELDRVIAAVSLHPLEVEKEHPHTAREILEIGAAACRQLALASELSDRFKTRAAASCALVSAELLAKEVFPVSWGEYRRLQKNIFAFQTGEMEEAERLYLTGRLRTSLGPLQGQDFRSSLVSWRILERLHPAMASPYWLAMTFHRQGNAAAARASLSEAVQQRQALAILRSERRDSRVDPDFGWRPLLGASPARGIGAGLTLWDDRFQDRDRGYRLTATATTRGNLGAGINVHDAAVIRPVEVKLRARFSNEWADYFGLGFSAGPMQSYRLQKLQFAGDLTVPITQAVAVTVGWQQGVFDSVALVGAVADGFYGPKLSLTWDTRNRIRLPQSGILAQLQIGTLHTRAQWVEHWLGRLEAHLPLSVYQNLSVHTAIGATSSRNPVLLIDAAADLNVPGIREFRLLDQRVIAAWSRYRYRVLPWFLVGVFGNVAGVGPAFVDQGLRAGAGLEVALSWLRDSNATPQFELGYFNNEWIFQAALETAL